MACIGADRDSLATFLFFVRLSCCPVIRPPVPLQIKAEALTPRAGDDSLRRMARSSACHRFFNLARLWLEWQAARVGPRQRRCCCPLCVVPSFWLTSLYADRRPCYPGQGSSCSRPCAFTQRLCTSCCSMKWCVDTPESGFGIIACEWSSWVCVRRLTAPLK